MANYIRWLRSKVGHDPVILFAVGAVIKNHDGEILLQHRSDSKDWGLPGGMMELGETAEQTMRREVAEETGLSVEIDRFLGLYTDRPKSTYPSGDEAYVMLAVYVCHAIVYEVKKDDEALDLQWFDQKSLPKPLFNQHGKVIDDYCAGLTGVIR